MLIARKNNVTGVDGNNRNDRNGHGDRNGLNDRSDQNDGKGGNDRKWSQDYHNGEWSRREGVVGIAAASAAQQTSYCGRGAEKMDTNVRKSVFY